MQVHESAHGVMAAKARIAFICSHVYGGINYSRGRNFLMRSGLTKFREKWIYYGLKILVSAVTVAIFKRQSAQTRSLAQQFLFSFSVCLPLVVTAKQLLRYLVQFRHDSGHRHHHETCILVVMVTDHNRHTLGSTHCSINFF